MESTGYEWLRDHPWSGRVRFRPHTISVDLDRLRMKDAVWMCAPREDGGVRVHNTSTGQFENLRPEDVLRVEPDPLAPNDGLAHAVVTLRRRMVLRGARLWYVSG
jgi:hypothetical protein